LTTNFRHAVSRISFFGLLAGVFCLLCSLHLDSLFKPDLQGSGQQYPWLIFSLH
jgi:hypothetical protein